MGFIARAFMAAWLAGLLALAHAGYDHSLAETYQWAQQLTHVPSAQMATMNCGLACQMLPEVADVHEIQKSVPYGTRGLVSSFGDDCLLVFHGSTRPSARAKTVASTRASTKLGEVCRVRRVMRPRSCSAMRGLSVSRGTPLEVPWPCWRPLSW